MANHLSRLPYRSSSGSLSLVSGYNGGMKAFLSLAAIILVSACVSTTAPPGTPDFTGSWIYNWERSDDARAKLLEVAPAPSYIEDREAALEADRIRHSLLGLVDPPQFLEILYRNGRMSVDGTGGIERVLVVDPARAKPVAGQPVSRWEGEVLVTELTDGQSHFIETYQLGTGGRSLIVTLTIDTKKLAAPLVVKRVYDTAASF